MKSEGGTTSTVTPALYALAPLFPIALANIPSTKKDACEPHGHFVHITCFCEYTLVRHWTHTFPSYRELAMFSCYSYLIFFHVYCQSQKDPFILPTSPSSFLKTITSDFFLFHLNRKELLPVPIELVAYLLHGRSCSGNIASRRCLIEPTFLIPV